MQVIRKTDFNRARMIIGEVIREERGRVVVKWKVSQAGALEGSTSTLLPTSLVELDEGKMADLKERAAQRRAKERVEWLKERLYVCVNVNKAARVAHEGHRGPQLLMPSQVKDGKCFYCGAVVVNRCQRCENPAAAGSEYCEQCLQEQA
jgi:hypothetical protein